MSRATPSSSIMARAEINCTDTESSTERPESSRRRPPRQVCDRTSVSDTRWCASERVRPFSSGPRWSRSAKISRGDIFVGPDEIADRQRESRILRDGKRIDTEVVFEARDQDRERERIEPGFVERQLIGERRQLHLLLLGDLLHRRDDP